jgi:hypothetical protein
MARLPRTTREQLASVEEQLIYDKVVGRSSVYRDEIRWTFEANYGILLTSPKLAELVQNLGNFFRAWVPHELRDLATIVVSVDLSSTFVLLPHLPNAVAFGVRAELIEALLNGEEEEVATVREATLIRYIRQVVAGTVDDQTFQAVRDELGDRRVLELTANIAWLPCVVRMLQAFGVEQPPMSQVRSLLARLKEVPPEALQSTAGGSDYAWPGQV